MYAVCKLDNNEILTLPFATRCVMSVSPRLIGPPPIDLVIGRLGDDTPKHQASSIRLSQTTAIIANSINYRLNMSRACNFQYTHFHYKTSLSPTLFSLPLQSLKPPAAPVPPTSLPGISLPPSRSHLWISRPPPPIHCSLLAPVRRSSPPDDPHGPISPSRHTPSA